jgi:hypothetical protein
MLLVWWILDYLIVRPIPMIDVSAQPQYSSVLGKQFRTQKDLIAIGYTIDRNYKKRIDFIALVVPPGFSGPEVVAKAELPKGALLEVVAVLKADTWRFNRIKYLVKRVDATPPLTGKMVLKVDLESSQNFGISETLFAPVKGGA